ncbi:unnamed protein product, partial [Urochloa humidicola]
PAVRAPPQITPPLRRFFPSLPIQSRAAAIFQHEVPPSSTARCARRKVEEFGLFFQPRWLRQDRDTWEGGHADLNEGLDAGNGLSPHGGGAIVPPLSPAS